MLARQQGFSLLEMMLTLALSSIMMVSLSALFPNLIRQHFNTYRQYRLEQTMKQALFKIEKDLRRAGFVKETTISNALTFSRQSDGAGACLIIRYDLNHNGKIESQDHNQSELFGYRLQQGSLEQSRGPSDCSSGSWEKIVDSNEIKVTYFDIETIKSEQNKTHLIIRLNGHWQQNPLLKKHFVSLISAENL